MRKAMRWVRLGLSVWMLASIAGPSAGARPSGGSELIDPLRVTFFALDRGDATLVQVPGKNVLIGGGALGEGERVATLLAAQGVRKLDIAIVQTWKDRHFGSLPALLKKFSVSLVLSNGKYASTKTNSALARYVDHTTRTGKVYMRSPSVGENLSLSYNPVCQLRAHSPISAMLAQSGQDPDSSLVMEFSREQGSFLTLGDTNVRHQKQFWAAADPKPWGQILEIGRNGAADALLPSLLKPLRTRIAVIPVARKAGPGPDPALLRTLRQAGVRVYRTDLNGTISITTDGKSYQVKTER